MANAHSKPESHARADVVYYVARDGNDRWSGTLSSPNASKTDGPFATIRRALEIIREIKTQQQDLKADSITVQIHDGHYFQEAPLIFRPGDSGSKTCPVIFMAYPGEHPVISGGRRITGWRQTSVEGKTLWMADLPEARANQWVFKELWVNGQRRFRARYPTKGLLRIAGLPDMPPDAKYDEGQNRFEFAESDIRNWENLSDMEVVLFHYWVDVRLPIAAVDEKSRIITFSKSSRRRMTEGHDRKKFAPYYVENVFEHLDTPGEWYLNRQTGILYYMPLPDEEMHQADAIAPALSRLLSFEGKPETDRFIEHIHFRGIAFEHSEWLYPSESNEIGDLQAAVAVPGAVYAEGIRQCCFEKCSFRHLGSYALELSRGCQNNRITNCEFADLGAGGIKIGKPLQRELPAEQTHSNVIAKCHIHSGGYFYHQAVGVWIGQSFDNQLIRNHIHDFYYTGISVGWTWGYKPTLAKGNLVEFNHVHHIGIRTTGEGPLLSDMGGIYTLGIQPGTVIRNNVFHDIAAHNYGGWGIYFDEGSTHILAENNIVYRTTHGGFHQHYGKENIIRNNIFAHGRDAQIQRTRKEPHLSFTFMKNIIYWNEGNVLAGNWDDANFMLDNNLYFRTDGAEIRFGELSWDEWQAKGRDPHSENADPLLIAPENDDYRLRDASPAFKLGFRKIESD
ncbi:right-handed parallel beta-helix repeat-containing protein [candidate division KSB1 bacterium]|nr:right-handed parallel beta-helix repeat-containing protein [candidate division KSB1 bacterium]